MVMVSRSAPFGQAVGFWVLMEGVVPPLCPNALPIVWPHKVQPLLPPPLAALKLTALTVASLLPNQVDVGFACDPLAIAYAVKPPMFCPLAKDAPSICV